MPKAFDDHLSRIFISKNLKQLTLMIHDVKAHQQWLNTPANRRILVICGGIKCDHIYLVLLKSESLPANIIANINRELLPHIFTLTLK